MRWELLWRPGLACERLGYMARQQRRLRTLRGTVASRLAVGHIESLELLKIARPLGIERIFDVGANVGTWALLARAVMPHATIEAFEPLQSHCVQFGRNLAGIDAVRLHCVALGPENGQGKLHVTDLSDASSMLPLARAGRTQFGVREVNEANVQIRRMDDFRAENQLPFPDLIKLDVQGYELEVLKGATECVLAAKAVIVEMSFAEYYERQCTFHETVAFLAGSGLFLAALGDHTPTGVVLGQADMIFLKHG
jgi:FkbM family methyltransferase